jgi:DNA-binding transcriptional LysR family regulator
MKSVRQTFTIDLRRLRVLQELAERGTVAATAEAVHLSPSAVSQQLATLSRQVGVVLLERVGRGVRLTPEARLLLHHAAILNSQMEQARADLVDEQTGQVGTVAIGAFATAITGLVAPALGLVRRDRPGLVVSAHEIQAPECFTRLDAGDLDIVVTVEWRHAPPRTDPRYARHHLLADRLDAVLPRGHRLADRQMTLAALAEEPWITGSPGGPCVEVALAACASAGFTPEIRHHTEDWGAVAALVAAGAGVALVPRLAAALLPDHVVVRPLNGDQPVRNIFVATRAGSGGSPTLQPVLSALREIAGNAATVSPARP